jgi:hypothetical protein
MPSGHLLKPEYFFLIMFNVANFPVSTQQLHNYAVPLRWYNWSMERFAMV